VQFEDAFARVEHTTEVLTEPARDVFDLDFRHQVQIELGPQLRQRRGQDLCPLVGRPVVCEFVGDLAVDKLRERGQVAGRLVGEPAAHHHCLQVDIEPCGDQRLVAAGHHHQLVDELVIGAAPAADLVA